MRKKTFLGNDTLIDFMNENDIWLTSAAMSAEYGPEPPQRAKTRHRGLTCMLGCCFTRDAKKPGRRRTYKHSRRDHGVVRQPRS